MNPRPIPCHRPWQSAGFTLIELLTVIAIIGILAAIIIPVVGKVRESARITQSVANLRSIGQAIITYTGENRQILPALVDTKAGGGFGSLYWTKAIEPYLGPAVRSPWRDLNNKTYAVSPALISPLLPDGRHHYIGDYGANRDVIRNPNSAPRRLSEITRPSRTVVVAAAETRTFELPNGAWFFETYNYVTDPATNLASPSDHGTGKIPAVFVDGHVAQFPKAEFEANRRELLLVTP